MFMSWVALIGYSIFFLANIGFFFKGKFIPALFRFIFAGYTVFYFLQNVVTGIRLGSIVSVFAMIGVAINLVFFISNVIMNKKAWFGFLVLAAIPCIPYIGHIMPMLQ